MLRSEVLLFIRWLEYKIFTCTNSELKVYKEVLIKFIKISGEWNEKISDYS